MWYEFANWSLEMGEKVLSSASNGQISLTNHEETTFNDITKDSLDNDVITEIRSMISQVQVKPIDSDSDQVDAMKKALQNLAISEKDLISKILKLWKNVQKRVYYYQEVASRSYFRFISLSKEKEQKVISATLRLLQLLVKHSFELQESLQEGLDQTPSQSWRSIIPQLFSRLNHPVKA